MSLSGVDLGGFVESGAALLFVSVWLFIAFLQVAALPQPDRLAAHLIAAGQKPRASYVAPRLKAMIRAVRRNRSGGAS